MLLLNEDTECGGELQLLDRNEVLLEQRLSELAEAVPLAEAWERQYEPVLQVCGRS